MTFDLFGPLQASLRDLLHAGLVSPEVDFNPAIHLADLEIVLEKEKEWPIQSWRVGNRTDAGCKVGHCLLGQAGDDYSKDGYEEEVHFTLVQADNRWELKSFSAVY